MSKSAKTGVFTVSPGSSSSRSSASSDTSSLSSARSGDSMGERGGWGGKFEFILTCIGFAVGLGNVWRFPYLCYQNGGGAFLIPYFIMLCFVGLPLFFLELSFGQFASLGPITIWTASPIFKGVGFAMVIISSYVVLYYNVIVAWCMYYFFASMTSTLPWTDCNNWWNTPACVDNTMNVTGIVINGTINGTAVKTPSDEYYYNYVLRMSDGIDQSDGIVWQLACLLLLAWLIIFFVLLNGIGSVGKASYFVSLFPYVLLTIMLGQSASLPGALEGIKFYMTPVWSKLANAQVWSDAAGQIFYSLGVGMGGLIAMSSYNKFNNNVLRDALIIPFVNCATSIYAGFVVFSVIGYIAHEKGLEIDQVATEGPGLVFVVYPEGLATMPVAPLWSVLFFFMMTTLGFSSQFSMSEGVCVAFMDEFPNVLRKGRRPTYVRAGFCAAMFLLGLPMVTNAGFYIFTLVNDYCAGYALLFVGFLECCSMGWVYDFRRFSKDIEMMLGKKLNGFWVACWVGISPIFILFVLVFMATQESPMMLGDYAYPVWANALGWLIVFFPVTCIFGWMIGQCCADGGRAAAKLAAMSKPVWGPANPANRRAWKAYMAKEAGDQSDDSSQTSAGHEDREKATSADNDGIIYMGIVDGVRSTKEQYATDRPSYDNRGFTDETESQLVGYDHHVDGAVKISTYM